MRAHTNAESDTVSPYRPDVLEIEALRFWGEVAQALDSPLNFGFRFAALDHRGYYDHPNALVHPDARRFDRIYEIDGCHLPVTLRRAKHNEYFVVGEALVGKDLKDEWLTGQESRRRLFDQNCDEPDLDVEHVMLDLAGEDATAGRPGDI